MRNPGVSVQVEQLEGALGLTPEAFDAYLRQHDAASGIRDFEAVDALAAAVGLQLAANRAMPANNQLLVWRKSV